MIRHVLLDADGVVQRGTGDGWRALVTRHLGDRADGFIGRIAALEAPTLSGDGDLPEVLAGVLGEFGLASDPEEFYTALWLAIEAVPETVAWAGSLRREGVGVHLVTNQHPRRAAYMKQELGYDDLFDSCFYSCDLGAAKPDPEFFAHVVDRLGAEPAGLLFVDDSAANVDGARRAGLHAEQWHHDDGIESLRRRLADHELAGG